MILAGDELGRTQQGNNNAYCQDNELSWIDWDHGDAKLCEFTRRVIALQARHPVFRRRGWFKGQPVRRAGASDIAWFRPDGNEMSDEDWNQEHARAFAVFLNGDALRERDEDGRPVRDDSFLLLFNAHHDTLGFTVPAAAFGHSWQVAVDTAADFVGRGRAIGAGEVIELAGRSVLVASRPHLASSP
jgi:glycogen operon protein